MGLTFKENCPDIRNTKVIDLNSKKAIVRINKNFFRPAEVDLLIGNPMKARKKLKWKPNTKLKELVKIMLDHDLKYD